MTLYFLSSWTFPETPCTTLFNDNHYLQIYGTAMGTKMAPSYANLFLGFFEANALKNAPFQPHTWLRYIDDIFMIWTEGLDYLKISID